MHDFTLPSNIKQIGSIEDGLRIYVEDYVCTFLHQYAEAGGFNERLAILVGKHTVIDGQSILFIGGAIHGKYVEKHEGYLRFSDKSIDYAEKMLDEHFPGMEVVGWMQSQPSYGTYLNQNYGAYHIRQFRKPYQVLFVTDPLERVNTFYAVNPTAVKPSERVAEISGYFIYYEKNTNMHEYMLANKSVDYTSTSATFIETAEYSEDEEESPVMRTGKSTESFRYGVGAESGRFTREVGRYQNEEPEDTIKRHQATTAKRRNVATEQKRATNLLASLCAVLFVVCFVMGVGLIRNQDRIERLEEEVQQFAIAHRNLLMQVTAVEYRPVFAEGTSNIISDGTVPTIAVTDPYQEDPYIASNGADEDSQTAFLPPLGEQPALIPPVPETYVIQPGDSLLAISIRFFGDATMVEEILVLNGIENADHIVAGRTIALPRR